MENRKKQYYADLPETLKTYFLLGEKEGEA